VRQSGNSADRVIANLDRHGTLRRGELRIEDGGIESARRGTLWAKSPVVTFSMAAV